MGLDGLRKAMEGVLDAFVSERFVLLDKRCRTGHIGMENYS